MVKFMYTMNVVLSFTETRADEKKKEIKTHTMWTSMNACCKHFKEEQKYVILRLTTE